MTAGSAVESVRADIWLWAARFFKTRRLAREAIDGGKVTLNDANCKPAKAVQPGDHLRITRGEQRFAVEVLAVSSKRGPASAAQLLYAETQASRLARAEAAAAAHLSGSVRPDRRPDKAARRALRQFKHGA